MRLRSTVRPTPPGRHRTAMRGAAVAAAAVVLAATGGPGLGATGKPDHSTPKPTPQLTVVADGLNSPRGLDSFMGVPIVAQGAFGPPGPVLAAFEQPMRPTSLRPLSDPAALVDVAVGPDGSLWALGDGKVLRKPAYSKQFRQVADIAAYQATDPDPNNTEGDPAESNPFSIAMLPNGHALVADAAGNDLLRVTPKGKVSTVARFAPEMIATDHLAGMPLPPEIASELPDPIPSALPAEAVPTSIAVTRDAIYVGELKGFPFRPGSSHVWKIDLWADGVTCDPAPAPASMSTPSGKHTKPGKPGKPGCTLALSGFTGIQDIAVDGSGRMYVYEIAKGGVLAFEAGMPTGQFPPAVLLRVERNGARTELAAGQLSQAGNVEPVHHGAVYVTDGLFTGGRLLRIGR